MQKYWISEENNMQNNQNIIFKKKYMCSQEFSYVDVIFVFKADLNVYFDLKPRGVKKKKYDNLCPKEISVNYKNSVLCNNT